MNRTPLRLLSAFLLSVSLQGIASAATDVFLKIGGVEGEVVARTSTAADGSFSSGKNPDGKYVLEVIVDGKSSCTDADGDHETGGCRLSAAHRHRERLVHQRQGDCQSFLQYKESGEIGPVPVWWRWG